MRPPARGARAKREFCSFGPAAHKSCRESSCTRGCSVFGCGLGHACQPCQLYSASNCLSNPPPMMPRSQTSTCEIAANK